MFGTGLFLFCVTVSGIINALGEIKAEAELVPGPESSKTGRSGLGAAPPYILK